jgi:hypothetical protein
LRGGQAHILRIGAVAISLVVLPPMLLILALLYFARPRRST